MDATGGKAFIENHLAHYGVKGMKWGVRKRDLSATPATAEGKVTKKHTKVVTSGGKHLPAANDAIKVAKTKQTYSKSGPAALSNKELQELAQRIQLEKQVAQLTQQNQKGAKAYIKKKLSTKADQEVDLALRDPVAYKARVDRGQAMIKSAYAQAQESEKDRNR